MSDQVGWPRAFTGEMSKPRLATALGGELQATKSMIIQFFGPTQHRADAAAGERLMHGPELILWLRGRTKIMRARSTCKFATAGG